LHNKMHEIVSWMINGEKAKHWFYMIISSLCLVLKKNTVNNECFVLFQPITQLNYMQCQDALKQYSPFLAQSISNIRFNRMPWGESNGSVTFVKSQCYLPFINKRCLLCSTHMVLYITCKLFLMHGTLTSLVGICSKGFQ